jgi:hypothetical protein
MNAITIVIEQKRVRTKLDHGHGGPVAVRPAT